ncbi:unnamed protein product [Leptidea sinapis]|uniref:Uncharacterized protein n=1 Tax=Leptidea sinapis TaxID=189913 RepID=A0A5E4Q9Q4_9NEOP|nr:unnamed protein product [Leptidea sinapis]
MVTIIKNQLLKHLSRFTKNLSPEQISLSALRGSGELHDLTLEEDLLTDLLELPGWVRLTAAKCNRASFRIQWTKLKTVPIVLNLDEVHIALEVCEEPRVMNPGAAAGAIPVPGKYSYIHKFPSFGKLLYFVCVYVSEFSIVYFNFGHTRISRIINCAVLGSRLVIRPEPLAWVLTDGQLRAALACAAALSSPVQRATRLATRSKAARKIAEPEQPPPPRSSTNERDILARMFAKHDVRETSYHLLAPRIDLHLCDDPGLGRSEMPQLSNGGALQVTLGDGNITQSMAVAGSQHIPGFTARDVNNNEKSEETISNGASEKAKMREPGTAHSHTHAPSNQTTSQGVYWVESSGFGSCVDVPSVVWLAAFLPHVAQAASETQDNDTPSYVDVRAELIMPKIVLEAGVEHVSQQRDRPKELHVCTARASLTNVRESPRASLDDIERGKAVTAETLWRENRGVWCARAEPLWVDFVNHYQLLFLLRQLERLSELAAWLGHQASRLQDDSGSLVVAMVVPSVEMTIVLPSTCPGQESIRDLDSVPLDSSSLQDLKMGTSLGSESTMAPSTLEREPYQPSPAMNIEVFNAPVADEVPVSPGLGFTGFSSMRRGLTSLVTSIDSALTRDDTRSDAASTASSDSERYVVQSVPGSSRLKLTAEKLDCEECPSIPWDEFQNKFSMRARAWNEPTLEGEEVSPRELPRVAVRLARTELPRNLNDKGEPYGLAPFEELLEAQIRDLNLALNMSTALALAEFIEDEVIAPPMPLEALIENLKLHLIEDRPTRSISAPPPQPLDLDLSTLRLTRDSKGIVHLGPPTVVSTDVIDKAVDKQELDEAREEADRLKRENEELRKRLTTLSIVAEENRELRAILGNLFFFVNLAAFVLNVQDLKLVNVIGICLIESEIIY